MGDRPSGTVTFLFTDIEGSTRLWQDQPGPMGRALERHDLLLRSCIEDRGGYVFKTVGDAFCAAFQSAGSAVNAALAIQLALKEEEWPQEAVIRVRAALHTGEAVMRDDDYFGAVLSRAARLMSAGHAGQVLLSGATKELVQDQLPEDTALRPLGVHHLRDLSRTEQVFQLDHKGLEREFPALKTLDNLPNNLPQQLTSFVGRGDDLQELEKLFEGTRLLTLTGVGGTGKTRLALQFSADQLDRFKDGAWLVELAPLSDPGLVPSEVAQALNIKEEADRTITETLVAKLKDKTILILLDNCEHLRDTCAALANKLLQSCPNLQIITSSREPIGVRGEQVYRVRSLPIPKNGQSAQDLVKFDSVALFADRACLVRPEFKVDENNAVAVAAVCSRLDGIPLAIELAAARIRAMSVAQINERLDHKFRLLTGGAKSSLKRQQTLQGLIDWSYDLLDEKEKALLRRLSTFRDGWTLEAAEKVCSDDLIDEIDVLDLMTSLVEKSLAVYEDERYWLLETVRDYAAERLAQQDEPAVWRDRHLEFFANLAEEVEPGLRLHDQAHSLALLDSEEDNMRAALDWASESPERGDAELRTVGALARFWFMRCYFSEGRARADSALSRSTGKTAVRAHALTGAGELAHAQSDLGPAAQHLKASLEIYRELGDPNGEAGSLNSLGIVAYEQGDITTAKSFHEKGLAIYRSIGANRGSAAALNGLASIALEHKDYATARELYEESLALLQESNDPQSIAVVLGNLGMLSFHTGDHADSRRYLESGLAQCIKTGERRSFPNIIEFLAFLRFGESQPATAAKLWGLAEAHREAIGTAISQIEGESHAEQAARIREAMGDSAFDAAWQEGRKMPLEEAVQLATSPSQVE